MRSNPLIQDAFREEALVPIVQNRLSAKLTRFTAQTERLRTEIAEIEARIEQMRVESVPPPSLRYRQLQGDIDRIVSAKAVVEAKLGPIHAKQKELLAMDAAPVPSDLRKKAAEDRLQRLRQRLDFVLQAAQDRDDIQKSRNLWAKLKWAFSKERTTLGMLEYGSIDPGAEKRG